VSGAAGAAGYAIPRETFPFAPMELLL
jgi:hypothetical protein